MPQYKVLEKSLVGNEIYEEGAIVEYDGYPSGNLEPMCDEGRAKADELVEVNKKRIKQMQLDNPNTPVLDGDAFAKAVAAELAKANKAHDEQMALVTDVLTSIQAQLTAKAK